MSLNPLQKLLQQKAEQRRADAYRALIHHEAKIGGQLFGPVPAGHRREFFCLDEYTWVWHEEWTDTAGHAQSVTTRYDVQPHGVFKAQGNQHYQPLNDEEGYNFYRAVRLYEQRVGSELRRLQQAV